MPGGGVCQGVKLDCAAEAVVVAILNGKSRPIPLKDELEIARKRNGQYKDHLG